MSAIRSTIVYRTVFAAAAAINLLLFVLGGFELDKLVIGGLFICLLLHEVGDEDYRRSLRLQDEIIKRQTDLIAEQRQAMGDWS